MKFDFDTFEFVGLIAPGSVVLIAIAALQPQLLRVGDAAIIITLAILSAYVMGHLVAAIGNVAEDQGVFERLGVRHLESLSDDTLVDQHYISKDQQGRLHWLVSSKLQRNIGESDSLQRKTIMRQMFLLVLQEKQPGRVETFNGLISLSRGLAVAFLISAAIAALARQYLVASLCVAAMGLAIYRMQKFNRSYAKELLQRFLLLDDGASRLT